MTREEAHDHALTLYWSAKSNKEQHAAYQWLFALGDDDPGGWGMEPCPEPECVALRESVVAMLDVDISNITRAVARGES